MKSLSIAAAAMLFGTSALAWAPSTEPAAGPAVAKDPVLVHSAVAVDNAAATHASLWQLATASRDEADLKSAVHADLDLSVDPAKADDGLTGMGGPDEPVVTARADVTVVEPDLTARPAAQDYPPCRPGPGDDNCIQLYEPGVRTALAGWTAPTGGLAGGEAATAVGGPYEPVDEAAHETAMNGNGTVDVAMGEEAEDEVVAM
jgi:hypothetical protein